MVINIDIKIINNIIKQCFIHLAGGDCMARDPAKNSK